MLTSFILFFTVTFAAGRLRNGRSSLSVEEFPEFPASGKLSVEAARQKRLEAAFAKIPPWDRNGARDAYKNLYGPEDHFPRAHAVRVIVDHKQRIYFQPEPYNLFSDPSQIITGAGDLAVPVDMQQMNWTIGWSREKLEWAKELIAHLLVMLSRALDQERVKGELSMPAVDVTYSLWDWCGAHYVEYHPDVAGSRPPLLSWNTRQGCNAVPTPSYDWLYYGQNFSVGSIWRPDTFPSVPWSSRKPVLIWRGSGHSWDGSRDRLVKIGQSHPHTMDIKVASGILPTYFLTIESQMQYKFILDTDGVASTFRLKRDLLSGATVFRVIHNCTTDQNEQFFYPDLVPWKHFVPVSYENLEVDLPKMVSWALANDEKAREIAEAGAAFARQHLEERDALNQMTLALRLMASKQNPFGWNPGVDPGMDIEPHMRLFCCADLKQAAWERPLAEVIIGRPASPTGSDSSELFKALFDQCVDPDPDTCKRRGHAGSAVAAATAAVQGHKPNPNAEPVPVNFFSTPLEWLPI